MAAAVLDSVKIVLTIIGGIGAIVALTIAYRRQHGGEAAERRESTRVFTDRFGKAADQLGSDKAAVRVAGVYAMTELADDWRTGRQMCINVLCAYLRMPYDPEPDSDDYLAGNREVRRTLIRSIRDHLRPDDRRPEGMESWSTYKFSFEGAIFDRGDLSGIWLDSPGNMTFHGVRFINDYFDLRGAIFKAPVWFTQAEFAGATVRFEKARFIGKVEFDRARFTSGTVTFTDVQDNGDANVTFHSAEYTGGDVDWGPFQPIRRSPIRSRIAARGRRLAFRYLLGA
jgi:hypothetical protein